MPAQPACFQWLDKICALPRGLDALPLIEC